MSIKPVGKVVLFGGNLKEVSWEKGMLPPVGAVLYALPDTHRVASVELLEKCTERLIAGAKAFQILQDQFGVKNRIAPGRIACETLSDELRAIIEDKP